MLTTELNYVKNQTKKTMEQIRKQIEEAKKAVAAAKAKVAALDQKQIKVQFVNQDTNEVKVIKLVPLFLMLFFCFNTYAQRYTTTSLQYSDSESTQQPGLGFVEIKEGKIEMCFVSSGVIVFNYQFNIEHDTKIQDVDGSISIYIDLENQGTIEMHIDSNNFLNYAIYDAPAFNDPKTILR